MLCLKFTNPKNTITRQLNGKYSPLNLRNTSFCKIKFIPHETKTNLDISLFRRFSLPYLVAFDVQCSLNFSFFFFLRQPSFANERIKFVRFHVSNLHTVHEPGRIEVGIVVPQLYLVNVSKFGGFQGKNIFL